MSTTCASGPWLSRLFFIKDEHMTEYRIVPKTCYDGCIPVTGWFVQMKKDWWLSWQDINDEGLSRKHAEEVLKILK